MTAIRLPSFFVAGPPRTGTSWLHSVLSQHASLPVFNKETRFFDVHFARGLSWYARHFPASPPHHPLGEVAPTYFASPQARENLAGTIPHARLIFIFRNPVQRIVSMYRAKLAYGRFPWTFEQALQRDPELMDSGRYSTHLAEWLRIFPRDQILLTFYDDLRRDPQSFIDRLARFVGIPRFILTPAQLGKVYSSGAMTVPRSYLATSAGTAIADWCKARKLEKVVATVKGSPLIKLFIGGGRPFPEIPPETLRRLYELFRPEVEGLESLVARDLSPWKTRAAALSYLDRSNSARVAM